MSFVDRVLWGAVVAISSAEMWASDASRALLLTGVATALVVALGCRRGFLPVLTAAVATLVVTGVLAVATRAEHRDPALPSCSGLMSGVGTPPPGPCHETAYDHMLWGAFPAGFVLCFGLVAGVRGQAKIEDAKRLQAAAVTEA